MQVQRKKWRSIYLFVEAKSYMEQRHAATEGFGTEKRLKVNNTLREPVMGKNDDDKL